MTHQIAGVGLAAVGAAALDVGRSGAVVLVGAAWLGSMLPDADLAGANVYRRTRLERRVVPARLAGSLARLPLRLLTVLGHRGVTRSLFACAVAALLCGAAVSLFAPGVAVAAGAGLRSAMARTWSPMVHAVGHRAVGAALAQAPLAAAPGRADPTGSLRDTCWPRCCWRRRRARC